MRRALLIFCACALFLVAAGVAATMALQSYLVRPLNLAATGYVLDIPAGSSLRRVLDELAAEGVLARPLILAAWARYTGDAARIQAGEYRLETGLTPAGLLQQLVGGRVIQHSFTLVEGWSVRDVMVALAAHPAVRPTIDTRDAVELARLLDLNEASAEGWFFPDTYRFPRGTSDRDILLRAHRVMQERLEMAWAGRRPDLPIASPYELLILASIVERETGLEAERPMVAGVFARRLRLGMRLQTDPTVIYGLGEAFDGNLRRRDLDTDTPWNTYTRAGLPPTPIAQPGAAALQAAARPAEGTALYFVATGQPDGSHRFSDTLEEHNAAVQAYLRTLRQRSR